MSLMQRLSRLRELDIGGLPAVVIVGVAMLLVIGIYLWRDHVATSSPSPNAFTSGEVLPGRMSLPPGTKLPNGMRTTGSQPQAPPAAR